METRHEDLSLTVIYLTLGFLLLGVFIVLFISLYRIRMNKHIKEKKELRDLFDKELLHTQLEIKEQTLKTISQEIHDNIGQILSLAKLNLNTMDVTEQEELKEKIKDSKQLVSKAIQDLRDLSKSMNTDNIEAIGLLRAIEYEMEMIRKTGYSTELNVKGKTIRLEPQKELILFRIIQEVLNNIIKHADANKIVVTVEYEEKEIRLHVKDNGKGFDLTPFNEENNSSYGIGIRNMHSRTKLIGADFKMISSTGHGTEVCLTVPLINLNL
jgi:two-component system, NarL family, sensor kinase